jgi:acetoin utilization deacetylase AcuC-like enzyme
LQKISLFYTDQFVLPLPKGHRFPMEKYTLLRKSVEQFAQVQLLEAPLASRDQIALVHDEVYVDAVFNGLLTDAQMREIGFPWTPQMVIRSARSAGATIAACQTAWELGVSANLAGGTHHAYADKGSGFCVFNDAAIAAKVMQQLLFGELNRLPRIAIVDLDVHQGNGTASILKSDTNVFTFSMHGEKNFPFRKESSDLDIALADGCPDTLYLDALVGGLNQVKSFQPDLVIYLAGADPYMGDRLGRLNLSMVGLAQRDQIVFNWCKELTLPIAVAMAGGYGHDITETVAIHTKTIELAIGNLWK